MIEKFLNCFNSKKIFLSYPIQNDSVYKMQIYIIAFVRYVNENDNIEDVLKIVSMLDVNVPRSSEIADVGA